MLTRAKAKRIENSTECSLTTEAEDSESSSESNSDCSFHEMENSEEPAAPQIAVPCDQIASLVSCITSLRECVEELRNDTLRVRPQIGDSSANAAASDNAAPDMPTSTQTTAHTEYQPQFSSTQIPPYMTQTSAPAVSKPQFILTQMSPHMTQTPAPVESQPQFVSTQIQPRMTHMSEPTQSQPQLTSAQIPSRSMQTPINNSTSLTFMDNSAAKLFPLPLFDGNPEDWPLFLANYNDTTLEFQYSHRQNLMRLHKALQGAAKVAVTSLLIYPEDVPNVIKELEFNFGRPELLIKSQLQKVQRFPSINESQLEQILDFANRVRNIVAFFKSARCGHHLMNPTLLESLVGKLPPSKQYEWSQRAVNILPFPTIEHFSEWLSNIARFVSLLPGVSDLSLRNIQASVLQLSSSSSSSAAQSRNPIRQSSGATRRVLYNNDIQPAQNNNCLECGQTHKLVECPKFSTRDIQSKWSLVKGNHLCFGCLHKGHGLANCRVSKVCAVNGCKRMHHPSLHQDTNQANMENVERVLNCVLENQASLFKILPITLSGPNGSLSAYAMFDEGSSITLLEEDIAVQLGLRGPNVPLTLQWYGESQSKEKSRKVAVNIKGDFAEYNLKNVHTVKSLNLPQQTFDKNKFTHFLSLPIKSYVSAKPVILLGIDNSYLGIAQKVVDTGPEQPIAIETRLGWVVYGPTSCNTVRHPYVQCIRESQSQSLNALHRLVNEYFSVENFGVRSTDLVLESTETRRAREILEKTTKFLGNKYEVGLLWKQDNTVLPQSYDMALHRLEKLEVRMAKDVNYAADYKREIQKYIDKGYARLMDPEEATIINCTTWYLPHFGVVNPHKPGKLRIVFDAAATTSNISLNSALLKGPEHTQSLLTIIFKFRQGIVAAAADVQEMFSQVAIRLEDQNAQRFLWRDGDPNKSMQIYVMSSMIFGAVCSPCCAEYVKNINALKFETQMPRGSSAIRNNMYVDDLVISFTSIKEAEEVVKEAIVINSAAGFTLRNFVSNNENLQARLNGVNNIANKIVNLEKKSTIDKVLGMCWNTNTDCFEFHVRFHKIKSEVLDCLRPPTKRELLGIVMAIYDPFGFLANVTICMKILLQSLWRRQTDWDELVPIQLVAQWSSWWTHFQTVTSLSIPRCYSPILLVADEVQLHVFVDASSNAYAAVAYLRICKGESVDTAFVAAKSRCAPLKGMTIPRLELQAAVLGSRLQGSVVGNHDFNIDRIVLWSDSTTVLLWIRSTTREYKQFVGGRIAEIISVTKPSQWRWLPTSLNVADDATRGQPMTKCDSQSRWFKGPKFLLLPECEWPQEVAPLQSSECAAEEKKCLLLSPTTDKYIINFTNFSSFLKLLRVTGWVLRFIFNVKNRNRRSGELKAFEITDSEAYICRCVQKEVFINELEQLRINQRVQKSSSLYPLTPFLDNDGVMKINGRIDAAYCLPLSARRPIIMPQHHHVTRLLVLYWHRKLHHQNDSLTINEIRQRFWVPHSRTVLSTVKKGCPVCIINSAKPSTPMMGQLPDDRLTPFVRPFSYTGVDYCGPFFITIGRRREKRWIALFTCLTVRAIHLEVAEDLTTDAFIICLRNFINRRGTPVRIRSDNGTNFVGAQKLLRVEDRLFDLDRIEQHCAKRGIEWVFNCPANPASGGCWERLVQCVKRLLDRVLKEEAPRVETFRSTLIEAENIINSRPLTDIPVSPHDEEPLTPNHFLIGCVNSTQTPSLDEEKLCMRKQWRISQALKDRLWKRWTTEYLPSLICRSKWREQVKPLQKGQLVIVCEPNLPRNKWIKGRIKEVYTAKDGQVRSALIQTSSGDLRRPAAKLAALNICESAKDSPGGRMSP